MRTRVVIGLVGPALLLLTGLPATSGPHLRESPEGLFGRTRSDPSGQGRIVAIGDIHGDVERLRESLKLAGVLGDRDRWTGEDASLVLVGDLVDRWTHSRDVLELVMRLQEVAPGRVHPLLGNHEVMNLIGDLRYVPAEEYASYATPRSEPLRERRYRAYVDFLRGRGRRLGFEEPVLGPAHRATWLADHPPGFFERREAFGPQGRYGRWLRERDAALQLRDLLFVHGGLTESRTFSSVRALNDEVRGELRTFDELWVTVSRAGVVWSDLTWGEALGVLREEFDLWQAIDSLPAERVDSAALAGRPSADVLDAMHRLLELDRWAIAADDGPLWSRGLVSDPEPDVAERLTRLLEPYGATRVVVGHTPTPGHRILARVRGRVLAIDTGISSAMGGRPSALEIDEAGVRALYPGEEPVPLLEPESYGGTPEEADALLGLELDSIEEFLRSASIVDARLIGSGVTKPWRATLEEDELRHDAAVQTVNACEEKTRPGRVAKERVCDSFKYNVAAYEIAKLLGLRSVVPTVEREFHGRDGAFTWWIDDAMTFADVKERGRAPPDGAAWNRQQWVVGVFDELIYNTDRNQGNLLVDPRWTIWMIDHTRAFRVDRRPRNPAMLERMRLDEALRAGLLRLAEPALKTCCAAYLTGEERAAILARRDTILVRLAGKTRAP